MDKKCNGCRWKVNKHNYGYCLNPIVNEKLREGNKNIFQKSKNIRDDMIPSCLYVRSYIEPFCEEYSRKDNEE